MQQFEFKKSKIAGVVICQRKIKEDSRGFFSRFFCAKEFESVGLKSPLAQVNHTRTLNKGTIRGLHYQNHPYCEDKLVSCLKGAVYDVALDIRQNSPTFLRWHAEILSADNFKSLYIPQGVAHGFQTLTDDCEMLYLHSMPFSAESEGGLNPLDPRLGISWPLPATEISDRDKHHEYLHSNYIGIEI